MPLLSMKIRCWRLDTRSALEVLAKPRTSNTEYPAGEVGFHFDFRPLTHKKPCRAFCSGHRHDNVSP
jgi:hypothetical protein